MSPRVLTEAEMRDYLSGIWMDPSVEFTEPNSILIRDLLHSLCEARAALREAIAYAEPLALFLNVGCWRRALGEQP